MKRLILTLFCLIAITVNSTSQNATEEKQREKYEAEMKKKKEEFIIDFVATLDVDEFQEVIIKQTMDSYFEETKKIRLLGLRDYETKGRIEQLDQKHFQDLKAIVSDDTMNKIMDAVKGKWDKKKDKRKKKKKRNKEKN